MQILRQSTAVDVLIGPFVDRTDGYTAEEAESPSVYLSKNGQTLGVKNDVTTPTHDDAGYYNCELDTTDTDTVGTMVLIVEASANALPVRHEFQVVEEAIYDAMFAGSATGFDANGRVDVGEWLGTAVTLSTNNKPDVNVDEWGDVALSTTDPLPNAVPGASGGLLIAGTNAATTFSSAGTALTITSSGADAIAVSATGGNGDGITVTGNGTGNGVTVNAGATGAGVEYAATAGTAFYVHTASGDAFHCHSEAGVLGCGIKAEQEGSSGAALWLDANTSNGYGLYSRAAAGRGINTPDGVAISNTSGTYGMRISGPNTYPGLLVQGGGGATGNGLEITCLSTDGTGVVITGTGTGNGMTINAGATGDGLDIGATSGQGTYIHSASGHGLQCEGTGVLKSGIWAYATGSASNGLKCEGAGIGIDCSGAIGIDVDGSTTYGMKIAGTDDALFIQGTGANSDAVRLVSTGTGVDINGAIDVTAISGSTTAANNLELSALSIVPGTVSNAVTAPTTTLIPCSDITEATADHYIGRVIIFTTSGDLLYQAAPITDYELVSGEGRFTVKEMTEAPANGDTFIIV